MSNDRNPLTITVPEGYEALGRVLQAALDQAAKGKGIERHANGEPFHDQRTMRIARQQASAAGPLFQAHKKLHEGEHMNSAKRAIHEYLGAINYIAFAVLMTEELDSRHELVTPKSERTVMAEPLTELVGRLSAMARSILTTIDHAGHYDVPDRASGPTAEAIDQLRDFGLVVRVLGAGRYRASEVGLVALRLLRGPAE